MNSEYLGKHEFDWGHSPKYEPQMEVTPSKRRRLHVQPFMKEACVDLRQDIERWFSEQRQYFDDKETAGEFILPRLYRVYGEIMGLIETAEEDYQQVSSEPDSEVDHDNLY